MRKYLLSVFIFMFCISFLASPKAHAIFGSVTCPPNFIDLSNYSDDSAHYQAHCGIWICLPGGFGEGCSAQRSAFFSRLSMMCAPLPTYSGCVRNSSAKAPVDVKYFYSTNKNKAKETTHKYINIDFGGNVSRYEYWSKSGGYKTE